jgi:hypothetical protein
MVMSSRDGTTPAGWRVRVTTPPHEEGGKPLIEEWVARAPRPHEAEEIVSRRTGATPDTKVQAYEVAPSSTIADLGPDEATIWHPVRPSDPNQLAKRIVDIATDDD